ASHLLTTIEEYGIFTDADFVRVNRHGATFEEMQSLGLPLRTDKKGNPIPEVGLENELQIITNELEEIAGRKVNPSSPPEVAVLLYDQLGLRIKGKRPTDTAKEPLDKLPQHPAVKAIRKYRSVLKMLSTYVGA